MNKVEELSYLGQTLMDYDHRDQLNSILDKIKINESDLARKIEQKRKENNRLIQELSIKRSLFENRKLLDKSSISKSRDNLKKETIIKINNLFADSEKYYYDQMKKVLELFQDTSYKIRNSENTPNAYISEEFLKEILKQNFKSWNY